ncbi:MAG: alpha-mannosidase, partial [Lachnospiraceae bacterium]|nr:alpha-mannosidase [Lachnospiraceae bacterium]
MILIKERVGKLIEELESLAEEELFTLPEAEYVKCEARPTYPELQNRTDWKKLQREGLWGGHREYYAFRFKVTTPALRPQNEGQTLLLQVTTGSEDGWDALNPQFLVYMNGKVVQGLDVNHRKTILTENAREGETFDLYFLAFTGDHNERLQLDLKVMIRYRSVWDYYYDMKVPYETARLLSPDSAEFITIIKALNRSINQVDFRKKYSRAFFASVDEASAVLHREFYDTKCGKEAPLVNAVGHTHIDLAWLWTLETTKDKVVRSFATVLDYMKRYPDYIFMHSQPQEYLYVKENCPEIYEQVKQRVKEGRWEPEGAMFVEADCNIPSGESLVRQFIYGMRFFKEEFGKTCETLWLPDVFGYSEALPQIMKGCNVKYFITTKISWNEFNKMPYDTFLWEGIDGSMVLTHFVPTRDANKPAVEGDVQTDHFTTYNGMLTPCQVKGGWQRYSQKDLNDRVLMSYGYGDGGGGPTEEMMENEIRLKRGIPGCPRVETSRVDDFFHHLEEEVAGNRDLPRWVGELYLEYHRGTYTSMARNKRYNRTSEFLLENLEFLSTLAQICLGKTYPVEMLRSMWQTVLKNQFHDILPGSSIQEVYEDSKAEYEALAKEGHALEQELLRDLAEALPGKKGDVAVFNLCDATAPALAVIPCGSKTEEMALTDPENGHVYPVQKTN